MSGKPINPLLGYLTPEDLSDLKYAAERLDKLAEGSMNMFTGVKATVKENPELLKEYVRDMCKGLSETQGHLAKLCKMLSK